MKDRLAFIGVYGLFWYLYFLLVRVFFLIFHYPIAKGYSLPEWLLILINGSWLDLSATGYVLVVPVVALAAGHRVASRFLGAVIGMYTIFLVCFFSLVVVIDYELYGHWGFRLNGSPVYYLSTAPNQVLGQISTSIALKGLILWTLIGTTSVITYFRYIHKKIGAIGPADLKTGLYMLLVLVSLAIPIRGGLGRTPINVGFVYFHKDMFPNQAAINVIWNFGYSLIHLDQIQYPEDLVDPEMANRRFESLYPHGSKTVRILNQDKPNVVLILLESFTSRIIEPLGGMKGITPNLNRLAREGILFSNIYSSGDRTDKGLVATLSGFPSQPTTMIIKYPSKTKNLPSLSCELKKLGYHTAWITGGDIDFANLNSYLHQTEFDEIIENDDFPLKDYAASKWGVADHIVFDRLLEQINGYAGDKPFFWTMLTLSSHEPYDVPMETVIEGDTEETKFLNAAYYTDRSLGAFISEAKKQDWWKNTLVILAADHGRTLPGQPYLVYQRDKFEMPLLFLGGALAVKDSVVDIYGSQTDIPNTLLAQISGPSPTFRFSKDLLSPDTRSFAFYTFPNGFAFQTDTFRICYDADGGQFFEEEGEITPHEREVGLSYLQILYSEYNSK